MTTNLQTQPSAPIDPEFAVKFEKALRRIKGVVDMPSRYASLFVLRCVQNGGTLRAIDRELDELRPLSDDEVARMEEKVREVFAL